MRCEGEVGGEGTGRKKGLTVGVGGGIWQEGRASSSSSNNSTGEAGDSPVYAWDIFCLKEKVMWGDVDCEVI